MVDLKAAYDSISRPIMFELLRRFRVPPKLLRSIQNLHEGSEARIRFENGELSDSFKLEVGLKQGRVISPVLFSLYFGMVILVIPLCGTKGEAGTCHNEFDNFGITLLYNPLTKKYVKYCLNSNFKTDKNLHGKETEIVGEFPPYCRLLSWRSRTCAQRNQFFFGGDNDKRQAFLNACKISEVNSIKRGGDSSSSSGSDNL